MRKVYRSGQALVSKGLIFHVGIQYTVCPFPSLFCLESQVPGFVDKQRISYGESQIGRLLWDIFWQSKLSASRLVLMITTTSVFAVQGYVVVEIDSLSGIGRSSVIKAHNYLIESALVIWLNVFIQQDRCLIVNLAVDDFDMSAGVCSLYLFMYIPRDSLAFMQVQKEINISTNNLNRTVVSTACLE